MSPWGYYYLKNAAYRAGWWDPFQHWRSWDIMDVVFERWEYRKVSAHLDILAAELRRRA